jgi:hypothetical protein
MRKILAVLLLFICGFAQAQVAQTSAFNPTGKTITFTANTSGSIPTPVQATGAGGPSGNSQYLITNTGSNIAFVSWGTSAEATANCVIPTGTAQLSVPVLAFSQVILTLPNSAFFCGITASGTSVIYVQAGAGQ